MAQQLLDMIARMGGADAITAMAARVGLPPAQAQAAVAALAPAVAGGMARQAQAGRAGEIDSLAERAAGLTGSAAGDDAVATGREISAGIFGGQESAVAQAAAARTGIDPAILAQLLPMVATLAASTLGNKAGGSGGGLSGGIGGMLGSVLGQAGGGPAAPAGGMGGVGGMLMNMLDRDKDGNPLDDIMGMLNRR